MNDLVPLSLKIYDLAAVSLQIAGGLIVARDMKQGLQCVEPHFQVHMGRQSAAAGLFERAKGSRSRLPQRSRGMTRQPQPGKPPQAARPLRANQSRPSWMSRPFVASFPCRWSVCGTV